LPASEPAIQPRKASSGWVKSLLAGIGVIVLVGSVRGGMEVYRWYSSHNAAPIAVEQPEPSKPSAAPLTASAAQELSSALGPVAVEPATEVTPPAPPLGPWHEAAPGQAKANGTIQWTGQIEKDETITIEGNRVSKGSLVGGLPGVHVFFELDRIGEVVLLETPSAKNNWNRLTLRSKKGRINAFSITWEAL
jgi:hypothetical protein